MAAVEPVPSGRGVLVDTGVLNCKLCLRSSALAFGSPAPRRENFTRASHGRSVIGPRSRFALYRLPDRHCAISGRRRAVDPRGHLSGRQPWRSGGYRSHGAGAVRGTCRRWCAASDFAPPTAGSLASWGSARKPGAGCSGRRARRSCTRFARFAACTRSVHPWRPAVSYSRRADRSLFRACGADHDALGRGRVGVDEVHGFSYFDDRDLLGFVDGTENPVAQAALDATVIGPKTRLLPAAAM